MINMKEIQETKLEFMTMLSRIGKQWGLGEPTGRIWGLLLFENKPLSQKEIAKECKYSLSLVSPSLSFLEKIGLIGSTTKCKKNTSYVE